MGDPTTPGPVLEGSRRGRGPLLAAFVGIDLIVIGGLMLALRTSPVEFGWFAYAPPEDFSPALMMLGPRQLIGLGVMALGLVLVAGAAGFWMALRHRS